jgi:hypothetical protein
LESVWTIHACAPGIEIGFLRKLGDFYLEDEMLEARLRDRYGDAIPLNEAVISPALMFRCELLVTVYERNQGTTRRRSYESTD